MSLQNGDTGHRGKVAWRHGEEAAVHKPRRGAQDASPLGLRRTQLCRHPSPEPQASRAVRDRSSVVLSPVCGSVLWGPQESHTASWGCGHRSTISDPRAPQPAWPPASQEFLFSRPLFVPTDTTELKKQMRVKSQNRGPASAKCGLTSTLLERSFLRSQTPRPSTEPLLTPHS